MKSNNFKKRKLCFGIQKMMYKTIVVVLNTKLVYHVNIVNKQILNLSWKSNHLQYSTKVSINVVPFVRIHTLHSNISVVGFLQFPFSC